MRRCRNTQLPGCFASGESIAELIEALREAVALYLAKDGPAIARLNNLLGSYT